VTLVTAEEADVHITQVLRHKGNQVATIEAGESVRAALAVLAERGIGALVVSADGQQIDGILSERDLARGFHEHGAALLTRPVSDVMTSEVHTCVPGASVHELARLMTDLRVRHVPVVENGRLIGIVSIGDVVKARLDELEAERNQLVDYIQTA
jgi:CBS domain-containing protein